MTRTCLDGVRGYPHEKILFLDVVEGGVIDLVVCSYIEGGPGD